MISYWEKTQLLHYDLVVLGGGITGIFCALHFRKNNPSASIAILERGLFSSGASTKNAGFACFGSLSELIEDEIEFGEEKLLSIIKMRLDGLSMLRETVGDHKMNLKWDGGYELFFGKNPETIVFNFSIPSSGSPSCSTYTLFVKNLENILTTGSTNSAGTFTLYFIQIEDLSAKMLHTTHKFSKNTLRLIFFT